MKKITLLTVLFILIGIGSCKKKESNPGYCSTNWATALNDEINSFTAAAIAYSTNPTAENCSAYKAALSDYIDALEPWGNCPAYASGTNKAQFDDAIANARADLQNACK